ncbi:MAG TPA: cupin domain-containing protein [Myxococcota bacterium]|nr:cupin domain-containing protein [Myxococcota bacterium]
MKRRSLLVAGFAFALLLAALPALSEKPLADPAIAYPANYQVLLENDCVRVMDFRLRKGDTERLHRHPAHVLYVLEGFEIEFTFADGSKGMRVARAGDVLFSDPVAHSPVNVGGTDAHGILIELKNPAMCPSPQR